MCSRIRIWYIWISVLKERCRYLEHEMVNVCGYMLHLYICWMTQNCACPLDLHPWYPSLCTLYSNLCTLYSSLYPLFSSSDVLYSSLRYTLGFIHYPLGFILYMQFCDNMTVLKWYMLTQWIRNHNIITNITL